MDAVFSRSLVTAETESLMLEILKRLQADMSELKFDIHDIKVRTGLPEGHVASLLAAQHHTNERLDRLSSRVERIERRLDLVEVK